MRQVFIGLIALLAAGCGTSPTGPYPEPEISRQDEPFYYYQDSPIYLGVDSTKVVIATDSTTAAGVGSLLDKEGVHAVSVVRMEIAGGHWTVNLAPGTSRADAERAAELLRGTRRIDFASNAYTSLSTGRSMMVINQFIVRFEETTTESEIRRLNRTVGCVVVSKTERDGWRYILAFPRYCAYTPLEIAAYYDEQPTVIYSEPNFYSSGWPWP